MDTRANTERSATRTGGRTSDRAGASGRTRRGADRQFAVGLARAFGGAIFFSLPLLMTMEMWWLGFHVDRLRLAAFLVLLYPLLVGLSYFGGCKRTSSRRDDAEDALVAYVVGFATSAIVLGLMHLLGSEMSADELLGKVSLEAVPASFGAMLAQGQLGGDDEVEEAHKEHAGYWGELLLMAAGAIFFAFNIAPTEEVILIAFTMTPWHVVGLAVASLAMMHAFVYAVEFKGQTKRHPHETVLSTFVHYTVVGYALALLLSAYVLWTFGRFGDSGAAYVVATTIVLAFPASLGAAAARLVL